MARTLPALARDWALFLDLDGTLLDYAPRPDAVIVPSSLRRSLSALAATLGGALAIVSGRPIADLDRLLAPLHLPAAGQHGAEMRRETRVHVFAAAPALAAILAPVEAFAEREPAILIEHKGLSAAVHYAGIEAARDGLEAMLATGIARSDGAFRLLASRLAFDVVPAAANKGGAVEWFMAEAPFAGRVPVFIGDDRTDEDGFAAVAARGGHAIQIGRRGESIASWTMPTPQDLRDWLEAAAAELEPQR
jgi:trehalose 6-phosphate phosphatase